MVKTTTAGLATTHTGVLAMIATSLENGDAWIAAGSVSDENTPAIIPTLRSHIIRTLGCDKRAGVIAYWDWQEITALISECWTALEPVTGPRPELWSNEPDRTVTQIIDALRSAVGDIAVPETPFERRPWSKPGTVSTCRIPFVPLASVIHVWLAEQVPLRQVLDDLNLRMGSDPWEILRAADPVARNLPEPTDVRVVADEVKKWMSDQVPQRHSPAIALHAAATAIGDSTTPDALRTWAQRGQVTIGSDDLYD